MLGISYGVSEFIETIIEFAKIKNPYKIYLLTVPQEKYYYLWIYT